MINIDKLTKSFIYKDIDILNEADEVLTPPTNNKDQDSNQNNKENKEPNPTNNTEQIKNDDQQNDDIVDNFENNEFNDEQYNDIDLEPPKLKILSSLTDTEYKMCNLRCLRQFHNLRRNVQDMLNNNIMDIKIIDNRYRKIISYVENNLYSMISDMADYTEYKFGDIYEDNIMAYITFLKRYKIAMRIINLVLLEDKKEN